MILITGAAGLLGGELLRRLRAAGCPVRGFDLAPTTDADFSAGENCLRGDLLDPTACRRACEGVRAVIHTAARQHHSGMPRWGRERFFTANVDMTQNIAAAAAAAGARHFIFISSDMVYGLPVGRPFTEADAPRPIGPYGRSKLASERACAAVRRHGLVVTIFRPRLLVGPGRLGILKKLFDRIRVGRSVPMLGDGRGRYQMAAVSDVADACLAALDRPVDEVMNLGSADPPTVRDLLGDLCRRAGTGSSLRSLPRRPARAALWALHAVRLAPLTPEQFRIADRDYVLDCSRARQFIGWQPGLNDADMLWDAYRTYVADPAAPAHRAGGSPDLSRDRRRGAPAVLNGARGN